MTNSAHRFVLIHTRDAAHWRARLSQHNLAWTEWPCNEGVLFWHSTHPQAHMDETGASLLIGHARNADGDTLNSRDVRQRSRTANSGHGAFSPLPQGNFAEVLAEHTGASVRLNATSTQWVCFARQVDGIVISDDLPGLCALLAPVEIDPEALLHHMAFRRQLAGRTYLRGIRRLLPGYAIAIDDGYKQHLVARLSDLMPLEQFDRVTETNVAMFESTAERVVGASMDQPAALLLSGGVDSTLIGSLMRAHLPFGAPLKSFSYVVHVPEFEREVDYARVAATRLNAEHTFFNFDLQRYPEWLETTVAACAAPISEEQMPCFVELIEHLAGQTVRQFYSGEGADDILGIPGARRWLQVERYRRTPGIARLFSLAGVALERILPDKAFGLREQGQLIPTLSDRLSPHHPANDYGYSDWDMLGRTFGAQRVRDTIAQRVAVLEAHLPVERLTLVDYVHQLDMVNEMMQSESLTTALFAQHGLSLISPYMDSEVVAAAYAFHSRIRFHANEQTKWLPRLLVERRAQADAAYLLKAHGGFPQHIAWELKQGQLHERLRAMPRPVWLSAADFEQKLDQPDWLTWNLLTWHIFEQWVCTLNATWAKAA